MEHLKYFRAYLTFLFISAIFSDVASAQSQRAATGTLTRTTVHHSDGSKEIIYPDGRREHRNADGTRRGKTKVCSNGPTGGNIVTCYYVD